MSGIGPISSGDAARATVNMGVSTRCLCCGLCDSDFGEWLARAGPAEVFAATRL